MVPTSSVQSRSRSAENGAKKRFHSSFLRVLCTTIIAVSQTTAGAQTLPIRSPFPVGFDFAGTWICVGSFRGGTVHKSVFQGRRAVGGTWLELDEVDQQPATGYLAQYLIGYDDYRHRFAEFDASNSAANSYFSEAGWVEHTLTMTSEPLHDEKLAYARDRFVYTVNTNRGFSVDWQVQKPDASEWLDGDHLDCHKKS